MRIYIVIFSFQGMTNPVKMDFFSSLLLKPATMQSPVKPEESPNNIPQQPAPQPPHSVIIFWNLKYQRNMNIDHLILQNLSNV